MDIASRSEQAPTVIVTRDGRFSCEDIRRLLASLAERPHGRPAAAPTWAA